MLNHRSFSEILEELAPHESRATTDLTATGDNHYENHLEPFGLSQILQMRSSGATASLYKFKTKKAYPRSLPPKKLILRLPHQLNEAQTQALNILKSYNPQISDNFLLHELKSTYRLSVLKTHPDQGGNCETFQQVKKSYQILLVLVKN